MRLQCGRGRPPRRQLIDLSERRRRGASWELEVGEDRVLPFPRRGLRGPRLGPDTLPSLCRARHRDGYAGWEPMPGRGAGAVRYGPSGVDGPA